MQSDRITLSPQQLDRLERFEARFPATRFDVTEQDRFSLAVTLEAEDIATCAVLLITATGRTLEV